MAAAPSPELGWTIPDEAIPFEKMDVAKTLLIVSPAGERRAIAFRYEADDDADVVACREGPLLTAAPYVLRVDDAADPERCVSRQAPGRCP
jgi:hypothetical protein